MIEFTHPALETQVDPLFESMNYTDRSEMSALSGGRSVAMLKAIVAQSAYSWCALIDSRPVAMGGIIASSTGYAGWMVADSDTLYRYRKSFLRASREETARMRAFAPGFVTHVDQRWRKSLKWLQWLGFQPVGEFEFNGRRGVKLQA